MPGYHTSRDFESELRELRAHLLAMGARCERSVQLALKAFIEGSAELTAEVKLLDRHIDRDEMESDDLALRILALRQPVAHDLRLLATALKLVTDLERIGDEAVNIAERAEEAGEGSRLGARIRTFARWPTSPSRCCATRSTPSSTPIWCAPSGCASATTPSTSSMARRSPR